METIGWIIAIVYIICIIIIVSYWILFIFQLIAPSRLQIDLGMVSYGGRFVLSLIQILYSPIALVLFVSISLIILFLFIIYKYIFVPISRFKLFGIGCKIYKKGMKMPLMIPFKKLGFFAILERLFKNQSISKPISNFMFENVFEPYSKHNPRLHAKLKDKMFFSDESLDLDERCGEKLYKDRNGNDQSRNSYRDEQLNQQIEKEKNDNYAQCMRGSHKPITPDMSDVMVSVTNAQNQFSSVNCAFLHG